MASTRQQSVPVTMGSPRFRTLETGSFGVIDAWFPPGETLHPHTHARGILATMVAGSFETSIMGRRLSCVPGTVWSEPAEERHANAIGPRGARALVLQLDPSRAEPLLPFDVASRDVVHLRHAGIAAAARRILGELDAPDRFTPLVIESAGIDMMVAVARLASPRRRHHAPPPPLILAVQELLHERVRSLPQLAELAALVGVPPWRLAREFRRHFGTSLGAYARSVRLTWALDQLTTRDATISEIAHEAGYADQSHFTRACSAALGTGPAEVRRRARAQRPPT